MNQKTVGLTSRAAMLALAFIMVAGLALLPLDGVAYAQTAAPANLQAAATPDGSAVNVSWGAVADADSYSLYRRVNGGAWSSAMPMNGTSYSDTNVSAGMTYGYYVRAVTGGTVGPWSNYAEATVPGGVSRPTAAPANLTVTADSLTAVDISWGAVTGAASYEIYRWDGTAGTWIRDLTGTSHSDSNVTSGSTYSYNIRAVNAAGMGPWSGYQSVTLQDVTSVPVLSLAHDERGVIELSWTAVAAGATYELDRRKSTGGWVSVTLADATATSHTDNITDAGTYYYRVRAVVNDEEGPWSNEKRTIVPETGRRPGTPTITSAEPTGSTAIVIKWSVSEPDNATEYILQWKSGSQDWSSSRQRKPSDKTYTLEGLRAAVEYTFRVQAVNVNGPSEWSAEMSATTFSSAVTRIDGRLGPPQGVRVEDKSTTNSDGVINRKLKVSWNRVQDATHYQVYKWLDVDGADTASYAWVQELKEGGDAVDSFEVVAGTSYEDDHDQDNSAAVDVDGTPTGDDDSDPDDLKPGMTYVYVVRALVADDTAGDGVTSDDVTEYGEWSAYASGTTKAYKPAKPVLSAEVRGGNAIWLAWTVDSADSAEKIGATTGYQLQYRRTGSGSSWTTFRDLADGMKNYFHQNLGSGMTYFYKVRGMNNSGYGPWSEVQERKIPSQAKPGTPEGVTVVDISTYASDGTLEPKLKVSWNKVTGTTGYEVQRWTMMTDDETEEVTWKWMQAGTTDSGTKTSVEVEDGLMEGMTYHFVVRAVNGGIEGEWSASAYGTTRQMVPSAPTLVPVTVGEKMIRLSWTAVPGTDSYELGFIKTTGSLAADGTPPRRPEHYTVIPVTGTHFTHSGRTAGTSYEYRIRGVLPANVFTEWSEIMTAVTRPARPAKFTAKAMFGDHDGDDGTTPERHYVTLTWNKVTSEHSVDSADLVYDLWFMESGGDWMEITIDDLAVACPTDADMCTVMHATDDGDPVRSTTYSYRLRVQGDSNDSMTFGYWVYQRNVRTGTER